MTDPCKNCKELMDKYGLNSPEFMYTKSDLFTQTPMERPKTREEALVGFTTKLEIKVRRRKGWTYMEPRKLPCSSL